MSHPKLPTLRALTAELRTLHEAWSHPDAGGEYVCLVLDCGEWRAMAVPVALDYDLKPMHGREYVPGSVERECPMQIAPCSTVGCSVCNGSGRVSAPAPFDAVAAARRLLADAREAKP